MALPFQGLDLGAHQGQPLGHGGQQIADPGKQGSERLHGGRLAEVSQQQRLQYLSMGPQQAIQLGPLGQGQRLTGPEVVGLELAVIKNLLFHRVVDEGFDFLFGQYRLIVVGLGHSATY